ncbi:hypothetical protein [Zhongshania aliphaticivorans]|uniref:hypothetical protein n=1 Tax=Zhongshania aliphaticivorans TaxID=1470434 RepID=UPI0012E5D12C|nr:hypothetical protein [Zhongshania aliphaticivorans]CAA0103612.1 Uncharacterised protein [Zhongshania aliphaticivorans]
MKVWVVDIAALDASDELITLRFASGDYTQVDAGPLHHFYDPKLTQPALFQVLANTGVLLPGGGRTSIGQVELLNTDGELNALADYAVDGRLMTLRRVENGTATTVLTATVERMTFAGNRVIFSLRDPLAALDQAIESNVYAGTNILPDGTEGTVADIGGTRKPLVFGSVVNATPILVNTSKLVYQVHDGSDVSVTAVRDRGVTLTHQGSASSLSNLLAVAPDPGKYRDYQGYFCLGTAGKAVTCDAARDNMGAGDVFDEIVSDAGFVVDSSDIAALNAIGDVGIYVTDEMSRRLVLETVAHGCGCYYALNEDGVIRVVALAAPTTADITIETWQIASLDRIATGSGENGLPITKVTLRADRVATVQNDLAEAAVNPARYTTEYRNAVAEDTAVRTRHPLAGELIIDSPLRSVGAAQGVVDTLLPLLKVRRDRTECGVKPRRATDEIQSEDFDISALFLGANVRLNTERLGYPRTFVLLGWRLDAIQDRVYLMLWG